ncbi:unnamed protein product [Amoebophrya sp. A25]|nr:unnamed protein product [Amoebophrya sp. A25]|eukprot:GSA25T00002421001.1
MGGSPSQVLPNVWMGGSDVLPGTNNASTFFHDKAIGYCLSVCDTGPEPIAVVADEVETRTTTASSAKKKRRSVDHLTWKFYEALRDNPSAAGPEAASPSPRSHVVRVLQICVDDSTEAKLLPAFPVTAAFIQAARLGLFDKNEGGAKLLSNRKCWKPFFEWLESISTNNREVKTTAEDDTGCIENKEQPCHCLQPSENLYIHCHAGISRSTTALASYLISWLKLPLADVLGHIHRCRDTICPNPAFMEQLRRWERESLSSSTENNRLGRVSGGLTLPQLNLEEMFSPTVATSTGKSEDGKTKQGRDQTPQVQEKLNEAVVEELKAKDLAFVADMLAKHEEKAHEFAKANFFYCAGGEPVPHHLEHAIEKVYEEEEGQEGEGAVEGLVEKSDHDDVLGDEKGHLQGCREVDDEDIDSSASFFFLLKDLDTGKRWRVVPKGLRKMDPYFIDSVSFGVEDFDRQKKKLREMVLKENIFHKTTSETKNLVVVQKHNFGGDKNVGLEWLLEDENNDLL